MACAARIVSDEGFEIHPAKTRVLRGGTSQRVTGDGETIDSLRGMAAFISMTNRQLGRKSMDQINEHAD